MNIYGSLTINFTSKASKNMLLEEFNSILLKLGTVNLTNYNNESVVLEIDDYKIDSLECEDEI